MRLRLYLLAAAALLSLGACATDATELSLMDAPASGCPQLGCATEANLAAMVADPRDLTEGRALSPATGDRALAALLRDQSGERKPLPATPSTSGGS
jgi:type IV pilus biogenesis protein CpaD/CtpE